MAVLPGKAVVEFISVPLGDVCGKISSLCSAKANLLGTDV